MKILILFITIALLVISCGQPTTLGRKEKLLTVNVERVTYISIPFDKLPKPVYRVLSLDQSGYKISKAYRASDGSFRADMNKGKDELRLYFSARGELKEVN